MKNTATQIQPRRDWPCGSLPRRNSPKFAALMCRIAKADPGLAQAIREQMVASQTADKMVRRLLARHRLAQRRTPVLDFYRERSE